MPRYKEIHIAGPVQADGIQFCSRCHHALMRIEENREPYPVGALIEAGYTHRSVVLTAEGPTCPPAAAQDSILATNAAPNDVQVVSKLRAPEGL